MIAALAVIAPLRAVTLAAPGARAVSASTPPTSAIDTIAASLVDQANLRP